ncbi:MAG: CRISPR-associated endonuclease Cas1 [Archaeoglobaceae archaeon]
MRIVVDGFGKFIGVENGLITVKEKGKTTAKFRAEELNQLIISGKSAISSEAIKILVKNRVDVVFLSEDAFARISSPLIGTVKTRREQYLAYNDKRGVKIGKEVVSAKIRNQSAILFNLAKSRKDAKPEIAEELIRNRNEIEAYREEVLKINAEKIEDVREKILGLEGRVSDIYWDSIAKIIPREYGFKGRKGLETGSPRYAQDIVNAMLNYGYTILFSECIKAIELAGLDPYAGFLHADRSGRESLGVDLMECFRQHIVDRVVLKLISHSQIKPEDCTKKNFVCSLSDDARKLLLSEILRRLEEKTQYRGKNLTFSSVILAQAREIASFLIGKSDYVGFSQTW